MSFTNKIVQQCFFTVVPDGAAQQTYKQCQQVHKIKLTQTAQTFSQIDTAILKIDTLNARLYHIFKQMHIAHFLDTYM